MRRTVRVASIVAVLTVVACGEAPQRGATATDLLYFQTSEGVSVVAAGAKKAPPQTPGVPSTDWTSVVTADPYRLATHVEAVDAVTGDSQWDKSIKGPKLRVRVVSHKGEMVALTPLYQRHYTEGRTKTTLVVAGRAVEPRTIELDGNYDPEAFSTDGNSVFLLEYLPPQKPDSYRVRRLDLATEKVSGVFSVDAELQEAMRGTARVQAMSPDGKYLYTLYTTGGGALGPRRAFVHVLNLDELWAHCVDLPEEFGHAEGEKIALAVTPDSRRLHVLDSAAGALAEVDTQSLEILSTEATELASEYAPVAAHDGDHTLYVGQGPFLSALDTRDMKVRDSWILEAKVKGLQISADGSKVYAAVSGEVITIDVSTGAETVMAKPPGVGRVKDVGRVIQQVEEPLSKLTCAC